MYLLQNIIDNYNFLKSDFIGITINQGGLLNFLFSVFLATTIFIFFYLFGKKLRKWFFKVNTKFSFFINISLGYIAIGTGIGILGIFSLLQPNIIFIYLFVIVLIALYPFKFGNFKKHLSLLPKKLKTYYATNIFIFFGILLFVLVAFLRLIPPEITEDGYHTDLPTMYLKTQTSMHQSKELLHVIPYPQLPEMIYIIPIFFGDKEAARFIHFGFYLLIIFLLVTLSREKKYSFARFAPLLFVTTPLVIRYSSMQYSDFFGVFAFLLSALLIHIRPKKSAVFASGIIFGAVLATKLWTLIYLPVMLVYILILNREIEIKQLIKILVIFLLSSLVVPLFWYIRAYLLTGNPIYPIFSKLELLGDTTGTPSFSGYLGLNTKLFSLQTAVVFSPLFFLAFLFSIIYYKKFWEKIKVSQLFMLASLMTVEHFFAQIYLPRYLFAWYVILAVIFSAGIVSVFNKNTLYRYLFTFFYCLIFFYYVINTLLILPYGLGIADENKYLTRVLRRDNISYYDFNHLFSKWISDKDLVATYGIGSFYYANFSYVDIGYIFSPSQRSFNQLKEKKVSKLLLKGGDIEWFCKKLLLTDCNKKKIRLLAVYPADTKKYNLYLLK